LNGGAGDARRNQGSGVGNHVYEIPNLQDNAKEWRWRLKAANGRTIADSGEGYSAKSTVGAVDLLTHRNQHPVDEDDD
jgi:uncharacterized protein YegP (UPF0339 family)